MSPPFTSDLTHQRESLVGGYLELLTNNEFHHRTSTCITMPSQYEAHARAERSASIVTGGTGRLTVRLEVKTKSKHSSRSTEGFSTKVPTSATPRMSTKITKTRVSSPTTFDSPDRTQFDSSSLKHFARKSESHAAGCMDFIQHHSNVSNDLFSHAGVWADDAKWHAAGFGDIDFDLERLD